MGCLVRSQPKGAQGECCFSPLLWSSVERTRDRMSAMMCRPDFRRRCGGVPQFLSLEEPKAILPQHCAGLQPGSPDPPTSTTLPDLPPGPPTRSQGSSPISKGPTSREGPQRLWAHSSKEDSAWLVPGAVCSAYSIVSGLDSSV